MSNWSKKIRRGDPFDFQAEVWSSDPSSCRCQVGEKWPTIVTTVSWLDMTSWLVFLKSHNWNTRLRFARRFDHAVVVPREKVHGLDFPTHTMFAFAVQSMDLKKYKKLVPLCSRTFENAHLAHFMFVYIFPSFVVEPLESSEASKDLCGLIIRF